MIRIRTTPEDFRVDEQPLYAPSGAGAHTFVRIEKRLRTTEAVRAQLTRTQLVRMTRGLEHARAGQLERERGLGVEIGHREPLGRDRDAVLAPRITHVQRTRARGARESARDRFGRAQPLLHAHERVAARARRRIERLLVDEEILGRGADLDHANSGSCETGVKLRRCSGHGPSRASAAKWSRVE